MAGRPGVRPRTGAIPRRRWLSLGVPAALALTTGIASPTIAATSVTAAGIGVDPADTGSLSAVTRIVGAQDAWAQGWTGRGVDVAVVDTGVARVAGLGAPGQVIDGPDLSFDAGTGGPAGVDGFGHGTFMAGIIAGRDVGVSGSTSGCTTCLNSSGFSTTSSYVGVAPQSRIVNVKVGAYDGAADVTQVIAAVDWVTQHAHDPGMNIRVLNLSYGADSAQPYIVDPLAQAVEQAWLHGIVVVASAGNEGKSVPQLADPAYDPYVVAVGGLDPRGRVSSADDKVAKFAEHGSPARPVDVIAPAVSVVGLRVPGSYVDTLPTNVGQVGDRFQLGSGTSQAAAVASGVAALIVQSHPQATPDQVKALLTGTAATLAKGNKSADDPKTLAYSGHGTVNAAAAVAAPLPDGAASAQRFPVATGTGTLDATRNGVYVTDGGVDLTGQRDIFGQAFDAGLMAASQAQARSWAGGVWNGSRWSGEDWTTTGWAGSRWSGARWSGASWDGARWSGASWDGARWSSASWG